MEGKEVGSDRELVAAERAGGKPGMAQVVAAAGSRWRGRRLAVIGSWQWAVDSRWAGQTVLRHPDWILRSHIISKKAVKNPSNLFI